MAELGLMQPQASKSAAPLPEVKRQTVDPPLGGAPLHHTVTAALAYRPREPWKETFLLSPVNRAGGHLLEEP